MYVCLSKYLSLHMYSSPHIHLFIHRPTYINLFSSKARISTPAYLRKTGSWYRPVSILTFISGPFLTSFILCRSFFWQVSVLDDHGFIVQAFMVVFQTIFRPWHVLTSFRPLWSCFSVQAFKIMFCQVSGLYDYDSKNCQALNIMLLQTPGIEDHVMPCSRLWWLCFDDHV